METFEKVGSFYLGRLFDLGRRAPCDELLLYDSKDLTTHAVCVGMTGSGKTGLCLALLEEAAIDGVPAIAVDPKGDLGNLLLTFPGLAPQDFRPWIDESAAARSGVSPEQFAAQTAAAWREGLAEWGQTPQRIARFRDAVDLAIYTPGSSAGLPLCVLRSFAAPARAVVDDADAMRERIGASASGLLSLLGIDADPVQSREHILVSNLLDHAWRAGRDLDVAALIEAIQSPPFERVGVLDLETFYPAKHRVELAMRLNNLLASPAFAGWMEGEPLDVGRLLYTAEGKPRLSIVSIAHLSDAERMFFVTILLSEVLAWVRGQPGTSSLRAILYMDEVFGYFPPTANPPSKTPMLTLLKQARAFGLGVVLATQNPVDLDYKGLSNAGTWLLGRLQTERDKARVLEGLEGASAAAGAGFDRQKMEATLAALGNRVFLMNNVHDDKPVVFQTRWAMSYLRGPLTRTQIQTLMAPRKAAGAASGPSARVADESQMEVSSSSAQDAAPSDDRDDPFADLVAVDAPRARPVVGQPVLPPDVEQRFVPCRDELPEGSRPVYRPALLGRARLHFVESEYKLDAWQDCALLVRIGEEVPQLVWESAESVESAGHKLPALEEEPQPGAPFVPLPAELMRASTYAGLQKQLKEHLYRTQTVTVWQCPSLKQYSGPDQSEGEFRIRLMDMAREERDRQVEKLRDRFAARFARLRERIRAAEERLGEERAEYEQASVGSVISVGSSILGALLGRKLASRTNVRKVQSSARSLGRASKQRDDVARAEKKIGDLNEQLSDLEEEFRGEVDRLEQVYHPAGLELQELTVRSRKSDIETESVVLVWIPSRAVSETPAGPA